jgi:hypothetical protein
MKTIIAAFSDDAAAQRGAEHLRASIADDEDAQDYRVRVVGYRDTDDDPLALLRSYRVPDDRAQLFAEIMRRGAILVIAQVPDSQARDLAEELDALGSLDLDTAEKRWRSEGWNGYDPSALPYAASASAVERAALERENPGAQDFDIIEEEIGIGEPEVPLVGVRVRTVVIETVEFPEGIDVQREAMNEPIAPADAEATFTEDEFEITATGEEVTVGKEATVVERVRVGKPAEGKAEEVDESELRRDVPIEEIDQPRDRPASPRR